jgi:type II secretory pathway predicted ATPase ExeA
MYLDYYGLSKKPFSKTPDPAMLYQGPKHAEALARMEQAVEDRELMVLTGEIGCGKTTLSRTLIDRLPDNVRPALIINPRLSPNQLLRTVARRLGEDEPKYYRGDLVEQINELLFDYYENDVLPLIIIDEAQAVPTKDTFEEIRLLTNFQLDDTNLVSIMLMGQPELNRRLKLKAHEAFRQRVGMWYHLNTLDAEEVENYLDFRLEMAGRKKKLFTPQATDLIVNFSGGVPRWINNLASTAMIIGFTVEALEIDEQIVKDAALDLGLIEDENGEGIVNADGPDIYEAEDVPEAAADI